jgi:hypothetical protein
MKRILVGFSVLALASVALGQSFTDGFEGADYTNNNLPSGTINSAVLWTALNNSTALGAVGWFDGTTSIISPHSGAQYLAANYNSGAGATTIDDWLMSPVRTFNNGDVISFYTQTEDSLAGQFPDRLYLKLSTNGSSTAIADFATTLVSVNPNLTTTGYPLAWTQFSVTLTGLPGAGSTGRFAFNYNVTNGGPGGTNSDYIGIDDVAYSAVPEPASIAILGIGALTLLRRRRRR